MFILPTVAQVAAEEPETEAKMVQPITLVCKRRPGRALTQGARPRNMLSDRFVRYRISPIQTNSGRAVSVQLLAEPQMVMAMASPAARAVKNSRPNQAPPASGRPTHTPPLSSASSTTVSMTLAKISLMVCVLRAGRHPPAQKLQHQLVAEGDEEDHRAGGHGQLRDPQ